MWEASPIEDRPWRKPMRGLTVGDSTRQTVRAVSLTYPSPFHNPLPLHPFTFLANPKSFAIKRCRPWCGRPAVIGKKRIRRHVDRLRRIIPGILCPAVVADKEVIAIRQIVE